MLERLGLDGRLSRGGFWGLLGVLLGLVAINLPELGSDPWPFRPGAVDPQGLLAPLVRAAGEEWDVGIARAICFLAGLAVALVGTLSFRRRDFPAWSAVLLVAGVALALLAPSTLLQIGLRDATEPWFHTNDSIYQIEIASDLVLDGENPYGHDYRDSGMERFYTRDGTASERVREREVSLRHYAYFPGTSITGSVWRLLPSPFDDYRLFVLVLTLAGFAAAMAFRAPLSWRLALGAVIVANPIAVRSAWFGQNDAPSLTLMLLAFALVTRERYRWAAASLAGAVLLKQFAVVAIPFIALMMLSGGVARAELKRAAAAFAAVVAVGMAPFLIADPVAFYEDTVKFGAGTYKIVGYGLSGMLVRSGLIEDRDGSYPFALIAVLTWLPLTAWLLLVQHRLREGWVGAAGFAISMLVLLFIGRTFNNYYLVWPMTGAVAAALVWLGSGRSPGWAGAPPGQPGEERA
ncbi:MAG: glycosyltransferase 87 family protein [Actinomycetota bacterium]|nr:glycosyltransferase 87 family protein [Actinomycetota bacterium]